MVKRKKTYSIIMLTVICLGAVIMIYPLLWMVASSFKPELMIFTDKSLLVREFTVEHYIRGWRGVSGTTFPDYLFNTLSVVIPVVVGVLLSCSMVGFAMARLQFPFKNLVYALIFLAMMLPLHSTLIPRYIMFKNFGWMDTYLPLTVPGFFATQGFFCYLFIQFMRGIPGELDQAARIDGCGPISIYVRIITPLSVPAYLTATLFSFIWTYDDFFSQLVYINKPTGFTIALALRQYIEALEMSAFGVLFAMSTLSLIPIAVLFICFQKYLVEGIATTGLKG
ncbi:MAG: carbohydrate ABC transporter permease [Treponema sp.]|jgi:multiple sugar transport system permease protein|nr:carbohydrate ABC transporter permease [Treponema sp.]